MRKSNYKLLGIGLIICLLASAVVFGLNLGHSSAQASSSDITSEITVTNEVDETSFATVGFSKIKHPNNATIKADDGTITGRYLIPNADYFRSAPIHGDNTTGTCGPVAAQLLLSYHMLALRPNDFDFEQNNLRIDESYDCNNTDDLLTKNTASNRTMPMFELTKQILLKYKDKDPAERIYANFNTANLGYRLKKLLKQGNLPKMTVHELRHTFITRCHEKSIDEIVVQKWVGHAIGSAMTKAVYTHIGDEAERKYIETMNGKTTA